MLASTVWTAIAGCFPRVSFARLSRIDAQWFSWHDANGDGKVQEEECATRPMELPGNVLRYFGEQWLDDLSLMAVNQGGRDIWRLIPTGFDAPPEPALHQMGKDVHGSDFRGPCKT